MLRYAYLWHAFSYSPIDPRPELSLLSRGLGEKRVPLAHCRHNGLACDVSWLVVTCFVLVRYAYLWHAFSYSRVGPRPELSLLSRGLVAIRVPSAHCRHSGLVYGVSWLMVACFVLVLYAYLRHTAVIVSWRVVCLGWCCVSWLVLCVLVGVCGVVGVIVELCGKWLQKNVASLFFCILFILSLCVYMAGRRGRGNAAAGHWAILLYQKLA